MNTMQLVMVKIAADEILKATGADFRHKDCLVVLAYRLRDESVNDIIKSILENENN